MLSPKLASVLAAILALAPIPVFAQYGTPAPTTAPSFAPKGAGEDPNVTQRAKSILHQMQTKTVDRGQFTDEFNRGLSQDKLNQAGTQLAAFGEPQTFQYDTKMTQGNVTAYLYHVQLQRGRFDEIIAVDNSGKVDGLLFRNALLTSGGTPGAGQGQGQGSDQQQPPSQQGPQQQAPQQQPPYQQQAPGQQPPQQQQPQGGVSQ